MKAWSTIWRSSLCIRITWKSKSGVDWLIDWLVLGHAEIDLLGRLIDWLIGVRMLRYPWFFLPFHFTLFFFSRIENIDKWCKDLKILYLQGNSIVKIGKEKRGRCFFLMYPPPRDALSIFWFSSLTLHREFESPEEPRIFKLGLEWHRTHRESRRLRVATEAGLDGQFHRRSHVRAESPLKSIPGRTVRFQFQIFSKHLNRPSFKYFDFSCMYFQKIRDNHLNCGWFWG